MSHDIDRHDGHLPAEPAEFEELVQIAEFDNTTEAGYLRSLLEAEGIPATIDGDTLLATLWYLGNATGWAKLRVRESDVTRARAVLERHRTEAIAEPPAVQWVCPNCGENVDGNMDVCWSCGTAPDGTRDPQFLADRDAAEDSEPE